MFRCLLKMGNKLLILPNIIYERKLRHFCYNLSKLICLRSVRYLHNFCLCVPQVERWAGVWFCTFLLSSLEVLKTEGGMYDLSCDRPCFLFLVCFPSVLSYVLKRTEVGSWVFKDWEYNQYMENPCLLLFNCKPSTFRN